MPQVGPGNSVLALHPTVKVPSRAVGGDVIQSGFVNVHRGEKIVPARVTSGLRAEATARARAPHRHGHSFKFEVNVNIPAGSRAASDPEALAAVVEQRVGKKIEELKTMLTSPRHIEGMAAYQVELDRERA
jgi:hypothetical protein